MKSLSVLLLTLASVAAAVPANKYLPVITPTPVVARQLPTPAVAVILPPPVHVHPHALHLPGFNRLSPNNNDNNTNNNNKSAPANDDGTTCEQITLGGNGKVGKTTLEGKCTNNKGEWWKTSINLNECITNVGGKLQYLPEPCTIDTVPGGAEINLKCNCLDRKRIPKFTYLEMGDRVDTSGAVKLVDGRFVCGDRVGDKSPLL